MAYSPKIKSELVKKLYKLKHSLPNKPHMTTLVNEAIEAYIKKRVKTKKN